MNDTKENAAEYFEWHISFAVRLTDGRLEFHTSIVRGPDETLTTAHIAIAKAEVLRQTGLEGGSVAIYRVLGPFKVHDAPTASQAYRWN